MRLTVVTSSYNGARFLPECIESVRAQKRSKEDSVEHLVVDANSQDDSVEILRKARDVRWISEADRGQSDGFNKGVAMASGDWICWLNSDDKLCPDALPALKRALERDPNLDVIYGHVRFIDENSEVIKTCYHLPFFYPLVHSNCYAPPSSGTFFRKSLLVQEPLDISFHYVMDIEWFLRCGKRIRTALVDEVLSEFRISSDAKTSEMIVSGKITEAHARERESYRRKHIYSKWPRLSEAEAEARLQRRRKLFQVVYYILKLKYVFRYWRDRKGRRR